MSQFFYMVRQIVAAAILTVCYAAAFGQTVIQQFYTRDCPDCIAPRPKFRTNLEACEDLAQSVRARLGSSNECGPILIWVNMCTGPLGNSWDWASLYVERSSKAGVGFCRGIGGNYGFVMQSETIVAPLAISLSGPSRTKALVAGPVLPQIATVTQNGSAAQGALVTIKVGERGEVRGATDASGQFRFTYVPPYRVATSEQLTGTCTGCSNTASKTITVDPCDVCAPTVGNPLSPAAGAKTQSETDWVDGSPHGLNFTRHYSSLGNAEAGFGPRWSHAFAASLSKGDADATVWLGDGSKVHFALESGVWVTPNRRDSLVANGAGLLFTRASDESRWQFDAAGKLLAITQRNGWQHTLAYDAAGRLARVTNAFGRNLQFGRDTVGRIASVTTPDGAQLRYVYDSAGRLVAAVGADGTSRSYAYEDSRWPNALTGIAAEDGQRLATFGYDAAGLAVSTKHAGGADGFTVSYAATNAPALVAGHTVDASLYRTSVQVMDPAGGQRSYVYQGGDGTAKLQGVNGAFDGNTVAQRSFDALNLPQSETDFAGVQTAYAWDSTRQLKIATTEAANKPEARTTQTTWHPTFRLPVLVTEAGRSTAYAYDALGNKLSETVTDTASGQTRATSWTYGANNLAATMADPKGGVWTYGYDNAGNRVSVKDPLGRVTAFTFDGAGRLLTQTEPNGLLTSYAYDVRGRLVTQQRGSETSTYSYTASGQLASATLPNGYQVGYSYDAAQRLVGSSDNRGAVIAYTLDAAGNRVREEVKDAAGNIALATSRVINTLNQVAAVQGATGQTTQLAYDANGQLVAQTDPLNQTTRQTLDALRRTTATTFPDNNAATQAWSPLDQLTQVTDPKGVATTYTYNAFGEVLTETSPDIGTIKYTRDAAGDVIQTEDAKGQITRIQRDALGRPMKIEYAQGEASTFMYDDAGFVIQVQDRSGSTSYTRDAQGRILTKTVTVNDNPTNPGMFAVSYTYSNGELAGITYPSGMKVTYKRAAGRITGIDALEPGKNKVVAPFVSNLAYTPLGQPKTWSWSNGDSAARTFDADGRITANEFARYSWDAAGRITGITQDLWATRSVVVGTTTTTELYKAPITWSAGYDVRNRLTSFTRSGAGSTYTYDGNSNRLTAVETQGGDVDLEGTFDQPNLAQSTSQALKVEAASNRLLGFTQSVVKIQNGQPAATANSTVNYSVDANGAMTSDGLRTFVYDDANRLAKVEIIKGGEAASIRYLHNAMGQRVFKSEPEVEETQPNEDALGTSFVNWLKKNFGWMFVKGNGAKTSIGQAFIYGDEIVPAWALLGEYDNGSAMGRGKTEYIWLPTEDGSAIPIGIYKGEKLYAVHSDQLGTPRLITDSTKGPVWQWPYSAFGNNKSTGPLQTTAIASAQTTLKATKAPIEVNLRFPGQYWDEESNLVYNDLRSYCPQCGRYTQPDPIGLQGGSSRFIYSDDDPLRSIDPSGLQKVCSVLTGVCVDLSPPPQYDPATDGFRPVPSSTFPSVPEWIKDLLESATQMASPGNVADSQISRDYEVYASDERLCGRTPKDKCQWLEENAHRYRADQVKATQKAWGCRGSRHSKGGKGR